MKATFSILVTVYNKENYVWKTIDSVFKQSYKDWELIIIDNNSSDSSFKVLEDVLGSFKGSNNIILKKFINRQGPGASRNYALNYATGDWVLFLDGDDLLKQNYLLKLAEIVKENKESEVIVGRWCKLQNGKIGKPISSGILERTNCIEDTAVAYAPWILHAAIIKRSILNLQNLWDETLDKYVSEDTAFWFKLTYQREVVFTDYCGAVYRILDNSRDHTNSDKYVKGVLEVVKSNVRWISSVGKMSKRQHESVFRLLESLNDRFHISKSNREYWELLNLHLHNSPNSLSMSLRRILGFPVFNVIKTLFL
ncbi:glycosyltransferase family A protein [Mangrovimonas xylaniphaga]|uniref:glycosyltransferase family A protein n=1 Tax=Mangrovimonas xylaniphaga TaxID=1645915 RepID=UPI0006B6221F|nr:glycosyltransferase family 2 protein [Mangrovimonas xylaniphaga]